MRSKIHFLLQIFLIIMLMGIIVATENNLSQETETINHTFQNEQDDESNKIEENQTENILIDLDEVLNKSSNESLGNSSINNITEINESLIPKNITESKETSNEKKEKISLESNEQISKGEISKEESNEREEKINIKIVKENKIEIEGRIPESFDVNSIKKKEIEKNESSKRVIISSEKHLSDSLIVYSDIPKIKIGGENSVKINWINENKEVSVKEFIDSDNDGFYERISWEVPHLSEQIFEIIVDITTSNESATPIITLNSPLDNLPVTNPVTLDFSVNYSGIPNCTLYVDGYIYSNISLSGFTVNESFDNGQYIWWVSCNGFPSSPSNGSFTISEDFSVTVPQKVYLTSETNIDVIINSNLNQGGSFYLHKPDSSIWTPTTQPTTNGIVQIPSSEINLVGAYTIEVNFSGLVEPITEYANFSVASMQLTTNTSSTETGKNISINMEVNSPAEQIISWDLKEGSSLVGQGSFTSYVNNTYLRSFSSSGTKTLNLTAFIDGRAFSTTKQITVTDSGSNISLALLDPSNNQILEQDSITFKYRIDGNITVDKCDFELYNDSGKLEYTTTINNPSLNTVLETKLVDFLDDDYTWGLYCNYGSGFIQKYNDFTVSLSGSSSSNQNNDYIGQEEVAKVVSALDNFTKMEKNLDLDEREALEDLGISQNITFFRKKLAQIRSDLSENIDGLSSGDEKDRKRDEALETLEGMLSNIPERIEIIKKEDFTKTSLPKDMEKIVEDYFLSKDIKLSKKEIREISNFNSDLQKELSIITNVKHLRIEYKDKTDQITLVSKEIKEVRDSYNTLLEILSESLSKDIIFITEKKEIGKGLFEIKLDDIENDKLIYYSKEIVDFEEIRETETILFEEARVVPSGVTGFSIIELEGNVPVAILIIIILGIVIFFGSREAIKRVNLAKWKKEENVNLIIQEIEEAKRALRYDDTENARESYHKIKRVFGLVPQGFKEYSFEDIDRIRMGIDRRDVIGFVKEYEKADLQGREDDVKALLKKIEATYKRLPKNDREKIYKKVYKREFNL